MTAGPPGTRLHKLSIVSAAATLRAETMRPPRAGDDDRSRQRRQAAGPIDTSKQKAPAPRKTPRQKLTAALQTTCPVVTFGDSTNVPACFGAVTALYAAGGGCWTSPFLSPARNGRDSPVDGGNDKWAEPPAVSAARREQ
jgi:hypothetical protein